MAQNEEDTGARVHFRVSDPTKEKILAFGSELGLESISVTARHLMYMGLQLASSQMAATRSAAATETMAGAFMRDLIPTLESAAASNLDTTAISRHQTAGARGAANGQK
jgi:hypothetical protein